MGTSVAASVGESASQLRSAIAPLQRQLRQHAISPYTPTQISVLGAIYRHGPVVLSDLAVRERLSLPTISKTVASLEDFGIVARGTSSDDRRVSLVTVTDAGAAWIEATREQLNAWLAERIAKLSTSDRAVLAAAIPVLDQLLDGDD